MKGDFSRPTFDRKKHYTGVLMQQGRVQTDADWNEQWALGEYRLETEGGDIIGACGAPIHNAGFALTSDGSSLKIGAGRYYVDGLLVENEQADLDYIKQPDFLNPPEIADLFKEAGVSSGIAYLDVWLRHITALDDGLIRESALGGPDTTTRVKVVWQVKILPVKGGESDSAECQKLRETKKALERKIEVLKEQGPSPEQIQKLQGDLDRLNARIAELCGGELSCDGQIDEWDALVAARDVTLNAHTKPPEPSDELCLIPPSAGYQLLENQLYRVEIHQGGTFAANAPDGVTFKWSRDNGIVVASIEKISGQQLTVHDVGPDDVLGFANGQYVEVTDDSLELNGQPGELIQIDTVNAATREIKLKAAPTLAFDAAKHAKLRRWDSAGAVKVTDGWLPLEGGIEVQFSNGAFRTGDYWMIPARTATGEIEWPPFQIPNTAPEPQPPLGIRHHYCRLAILRLDGEELQVEDCRKRFSPLTEIGATAAAQAVHVKSTNWRNDDVFEPQQFLKDGLAINLDAAVDPNSLSGATMIVTMEVAPTENQPAGGGPGFSQIVILEGNAGIGSQPSVIVWRPVADLAGRLEGLLKQAKASFRVRVTLKGHTIWSAPGANPLYLDGQAFGVPAQRAGTNQMRTALVFPTGNQARASDFESWFYFGSGQPTEVALQVKSVTFLRAKGTTASPGTIGLPPVPDQVTFKAGERVNAVQVEFTRAVNPEGLGESGSPQSLLVEDIADPGAATRVIGNIKIINATTARFVAQEPQFFSAGLFRLAVLGTEQPDSPPITAADDGSRLDGDFDDRPGGDLALTFRVT